MHYEKIKEEYTSKFITGFLNDSEDILNSFIEYIVSDKGYINDGDIESFDKDILLDWLSDYDGDDHDLSWWAGKAHQFAIMLPDIVRLAISCSNLIDQNNYYNSIIRGKNEIEIDMSEEDIQDLQEGKEFHWNFHGFAMHIFNSSI